MTNLLIMTICIVHGFCCNIWINLWPIKRILNTLLYVNADFMWSIKFQSLFIWSAYCMFHWYDDLQNFRCILDAFEVLFTKLKTINCMSWVYISFEFTKKTFACVLSVFVSLCLPLTLFIEGIQVYQICDSKYPVLNFDNCKYSVKLFLTWEAFRVNYC